MGSPRAVLRLPSPNIWVEAGMHCGAPLEGTEFQRCLLFDFEVSGKPAWSVSRRNMLGLVGYFVANTAELEYLSEDSPLQSSHLPKSAVSGSPPLRTALGIMLKVTARPSEHPHRKRVCLEGKSHLIPNTK